MKQYLVRSSSNWVDEIDFEGWEIMNEKELAEVKAEVLEKDIKHLEEDLKNEKRRNEK